MHKLESNKLILEFKHENNIFHVFQIKNKLSGLNFIPDNNSAEFTIKFTNNEKISSNDFKIESIKEKNDKLTVFFKECSGIKAKLQYWIHNDKNTVCKQLFLTQKSSIPIDYIDLENTGISNANFNFSAKIVEGGEIPAFWSMLGQPIYIDSLFYGCEFPMTENRILNNFATIRYYLGKVVDNNFKCPITVIGGGENISLAGIKNAFFDYIDFISVPTPLRF